MRAWLPALARVTLLLAVLSACATPPSVTPPSGFAVYDDPDIVRAVSPEGVRFRVHYEDHEPAQSLEFWREALRRHLERSGYGLLEEEAFSAPAGDGALFEWVAPVGAEDWVYLTAVVPAEISSSSPRRQGPPHSTVSVARRSGRAPDGSPRSAPSGGYHYPSFRHS